METLKDLAMFIMMLALLKTFIIGSNFNFHKWYEYGRKYTKWYMNHEAEQYKPKEKQ